ncbi:AAA family ATPase [Parasediminibacterium paludis]|uniref:AAA family ATPase n=1 Tax=Parasediminibacterium paludis TaxID=908966 RepID=A0ABV8Q0Q5_9BACT
MQSTLTKSQVVNGYTVVLFIKQAINAETYRVKGNDGKLYFLKLFNYSKLHRTAFDGDGNLLEIEILKTISHPNIVAYKDSGELIIDNKKFSYLVLNFIAGETLAERIARENISSLYDAKLFVSGILNALKYLHSQKEPVIHNEVTLQNVMLDLSSITPIPKLIDFGYARLFHQSSKTFNKEGLNHWYIATECFNNIYSPQSDLFSVGVLLYHLLFQLLPWYKDLAKYQAAKLKIEEVIIEQRKKPLSFKDIEDKIFDYEPYINNVIKKALHPNTEIRFKSADEFLQALNGDIEIEDVDKVEIQKSDKEDANTKQFSVKPKGKGFDAIAGMKELKDQLQLDVIDALRNPKEYERYGISIPNGMLLYGPPGCGKTFFSKRLSEEVGFNFIDIKPSSLQSKFVNATQENIAAMFKEAEEKAPTIIFIDELDALVPSREGDLHQMHANAVNEFLAQMNDCGAKGIFIIGASNRPEKIDPAILRAGRLDKKVYLPPPDFEARKSMFEMYLKQRKEVLDFGIDYDKLGQLTENFVSADIELLVNEASRKALKDKSRISMETLEYTIKNNKPTVNLSELKKYETLKTVMESGEDVFNKRNPIGFKR